MRRGKPTSVDFEIINIEPVTDYISECEIKVLYHGENRNRTYISKEVANKMANSLPGAPIVAVFNAEKEDFEGHGREIVITDSGEITENIKTVPYGSVDRQAPIVWQKYLDYDGEVREYMVAKGYLWTGRHPELKSVIQHSKGQSMELYEESIVGEWAKSSKGGQEIFIYSEADISALCILGDEVEPCFEGGSIHAPGLNFSMEDPFFRNEMQRFYEEVAKVKETKEGKEEGGNEMEKELETALEAVEKAEDSKDTEDIKAAKELVAKLEDSEDKDKLNKRLDAIKVEEEKEEEEENSDKPEEFDLEGSEEGEDEPEEEEETEEPEEPAEEPEKPAEDNKTATDDSDDGAKKRKEDEMFELRKVHDDLVQKFNALEQELNSLKAEKHKRELAEKEELCDKFSALGEEKLANIRKNLNQFSLDSLEKELSALAFKEGMVFSKGAIVKDAVITHKPTSNFNSDKPAWALAIKKAETRI